MLLSPYPRGPTIASTGRSSGFRIFLLAAPSRLYRQWQIAAFVPGYSGGTSTDSHRLPLQPLSRGATHASCLTGRLVFVKEKLADMEGTAAALAVVMKKGRRRRQQRPPLPIFLK